MTIEQELRLSYYRQVADIDTEHSICLVQDVRDQKFYVKKQLTVYNADIYRYLLDHPIANTPRLLAVEEDSQGLTVIEEYIPGDTLEALLARQGTLPEKQVIDIISQLCRILSDFHSCTPAIVNRDIKPSNIMLTPDGKVKLLDLNAAKWCNAASAKDTVLLGTQGYAAPEQYGFGASSILTDIYSVGVLMNELLTGALPGERVASGRLEKLIRKCVELSPSGRYQSIRQLQDALTALDEAPAVPKPKSRNRSFLPPGFRSRNPMIWLLACLGYALLIYCCTSLEVENAGAVEVLLNRIFLSVAAICIVLFNGNYLNIQSKFPMTNSKNRFVRWLGMGIVDFALLGIAVLVLQTVVNAFVR